MRDKISIDDLHNLTMLTTLPNGDVILNVKKKDNRIQVMIASADHTGNYIEQFPSTFNYLLWLFNHWRT